MSSSSGDLTTMYEYAGEVFLQNEIALVWIGLPAADRHGKIKLLKPLTNRNISCSYFFFNFKFFTVFFNFYFIENFFVSKLIHYFFVFCFIVKQMILYLEQKLTLQMQEAVKSWKAEVLVAFFIFWNCQNLNDKLMYLSVLQILFLSNN